MPKETTKALMFYKTSDKYADLIATCCLYYNKTHDTIPLEKT